MKAIKDFFYKLYTYKYVQVCKMFFFRNFTWGNMCEVFKLEYFRFLFFGFAITPIVAKFITELKSKTCIDHGCYSSSICKIVSSMTLPFSWKLMWFASILFLIASIIYFLSCPKFIKKYKNIQNYIKMSLPNRDICHEWVDFIEKNKKVIINKEKKLEIMEKSLFCRNLCINIDKIENFNQNIIGKNLTKCGACFNIKEEAFEIFGYHDGYVLHLKYSGDSTSNDIRRAEDYKEIALSLFCICEYHSVIRKFVCWFILFFSAILFLTTVFQSIYNTLVYIGFIKYIHEYMRIYI